VVSFKHVKQGVESGEFAGGGAVFTGDFVDHCDDGQRAAVDLSGILDE
jgi:hypothetical protein